MLGGPRHGKLGRKEEVVQGCFKELPREGGPCAVPISSGVCEEVGWGSMLCFSPQDTESHMLSQELFADSDIIGGPHGSWKDLGCNQSLLRLAWGKE